MNIPAAIEKNQFLMGTLTFDGEQWGINVDGILVHSYADNIQPILPYYKILNPEKIPQLIRDENIQNAMVWVTGEYFNSPLPEATIEEIVDEMTMIMSTLYMNLVVGAIGGAVVTGVTAFLIHKLVK